MSFCVDDFSDFWGVFSPLGINCFPFSVSRDLARTSSSYSIENLLHERAVYSINSSQARAVRPIFIKGFYFGLGGFKVLVYESHLSLLRGGALLNQLLKHLCEALILLSKTIHLGAQGFYEGLGILVAHDFFILEHYLLSYLKEESVRELHCIKGGNHTVFGGEILVVVFKEFSELFIQGRFY